MAYNVFLSDKLAAAKLRFNNRPFEFRFIFSFCLQLGREVELDDDLRQLTFYSVQSGDTIYLRW